MTGVFQVVGVVFLPGGVPCLATGIMGVLQGHQVVDVQFSRCIYVVPGEAAVPPARRDTAVPVGLEGDLDHALRGEDLLPRVLAVSVLVVPVVPFRPVALRDIRRDRRYGY